MYSITEGYWRRILNGRQSRRRALLIAGGATASGFLSACFGDKDDRTTSGGGLLTQPEDTGKVAQYGGVRKAMLPIEPATFDIHVFQIGAQLFVWAVGSLLLTLVPGHLSSPKLEIKGDVAQSWELSPDHLQLTLKLHPAAKWAPASAYSRNLAPASVFGRTMDSEDVLYSWERLSQLGLGRSELNNNVNPSAPIMSVSAPDASTVVFKAARPDVTLLSNLTIPYVSYFYMVPKEGKSDHLDFSRIMLGSGPFYIENYEPSVGMTFKRNPYLADRDDRRRPYVDAVEAPFISDGAQEQSQFRAGNLHSPYRLIPSDMLALKMDIPELDLYDSGMGSNQQKLLFGNNVRSPFKDKRVRQAMSYAWDRDFYERTLNDVDRFEAVGIPMSVRWNTALPCSDQGFPIGTYSGWWLDPQAPNFGPNAKYFKHDPQAARQLLSAAGYPDGVDFDHYWSLPNSLGPSTGRAIELLNGVIADAGFRGTSQNLDTPRWISQVMATRGNFVGAATFIDSGGPDPANYLFQHFHTGGSRFGGYSQDNNGWSADGDPYLNDSIIKMKGEFDERRRVEIAHDVQRYVAETNYNPRYPGGTTVFGIQWPAIRNSRVWIGDVPRQWANEWLDQTKAPFNRRPK